MSENNTRIKHLEETVRAGQNAQECMNILTQRMKQLHEHIVSANKGVDAAYNLYVELADCEGAVLEYSRRVNLGKQAMAELARIKNGR